MTYSLYSYEYQQLTQLLVQARKQVGLSQAQLAQRLYKPQSFVSKCENGERRVDVAEFCAITQAMGVNTLALLTEFQTRIGMASAATCGCGPHCTEPHPHAAPPSLL